MCSPAHGAEPILGGALYCAGVGTGGTGPSRGAARFKSVGCSGSLLCHLSLAPRQWEDDGAGGMLEAAVGIGPSLFALQCSGLGLALTGTTCPCSV